MSLRMFLSDILYESCDRVAEAGSHLKWLKGQVSRNELELPILPAQPLHANAMDVDKPVKVENKQKFFGNEPRALQPMLERNRRRHEFHSAHSPDSSASLIQVKAIRQKLNGACGFYSLFHSSMSILARQCSDEDLARWILRQMFNKAMFFVMMAKWKAQLLEESERRAKQERNSLNSSNWQAPLINSGVMERAYMEYLLAEDEWITMIKKWTGASFHALPEISLSQLKSRLSLVTLKTVDDISKELAAEDGNQRPHVFLIGQLNHWIAILSNRVKNRRNHSNGAKNNVENSEKMKIDEEDELLADEYSTEMELTQFEGTCDTEEGEGNQPRGSNKEAEQKSRKNAQNSSPSSSHSLRSHQSPSVETILLDSRNDFVLNLDENDITRRVDQRCFREWGISLSNPTPNAPSPSMWQELCFKLYEQSLKDTQYSCAMFHTLSQQTPSFDSSTESSEDDDHSATSKKRTTRSSTRSKKPSVPFNPHPITTDLIKIYAEGFFEGFATHVGDLIALENEDSEKMSSVDSNPRLQPSSTKVSSSSDHQLDVEAGHSKTKKRNKSSASPPDFEGDIGDWMFKFTMWVQEYAPLRTIEDNFVGSLRNAKKAGYCIPPTVPDAMERWVSLLKARIAQAQKASAVTDDASAIVLDLFENTLPFLLTSAKYLRRT